MDIENILATERDICDKVAKLRINPNLEFPILSAKIKLTWKCNFKCVMCKLWRKTGKIENYDKDLDLELITETLHNLKKYGTRKIHFSGGEVLLLGDKFIEILKIAYSLDFQINLTTNGSLLSKKFARAFIDYRVHTVVVSIDSRSPKEHNKIRGYADAWKSTWKGIENLQNRKQKKGRGPKIAINTVVHRKNIDSLDNLYEFLKNKNIDSWRMLPIDTELKKYLPTQEQWRTLSKKWKQWSDLVSRLPVGWNGNKSLNKIKKGNYAGGFYDDKICYAPWFNIFINADGKVYPCCMGQQDIKPYGNIKEETFDKIINSTNRKEICCSMASGHLFPVCEKCDDFIDENLAFNLNFK